MTKLATKIMVVDDEPQIRKFLNISLTGHEYNVVEAASGGEAIRGVNNSHPDLMILDLGLPDEDGIDVIRKVRESSRVPIIVLSVRSDESDKVTAFDTGANDYLTKPFNMNELLARVRACLRDRVHIDHQDTVFEVGDLKVDLLKHLVTVREERIRLTPKEYKLLRILISNAGKVIPHIQLIREIWGNAYGDDTQYLRIYIRQLRQKIELDKTRDHYIHNEPGIGYRLKRNYECSTFLFALTTTCPSYSCVRHVNKFILNC